MTLMMNLKPRILVLRNHAPQGTRNIALTCFPLEDY